MKNLVVLLLALFSFSGFSQDLRETFEKGNELYSQEKYVEAIEVYRQIADGGYENAALYYNMANSYYKSGELAKAILYYERAARLSPHDDDIRQNLELARNATIDRFEQMPEPLIKTAWQGLFKALSPGSWSVLSLILFSLLLLGTFLYLFSDRRRLGFALGLPALILGMLSLWLGYVHLNHYRQNRPAIVTATSSYVKSGPGEKAEDVFILHEGSKGIVTESYENWKKIKMPDGKVGWIAARDLVEI